MMLLVANGAAADTHIRGYHNSPEHWTLDGSPYIIDDFTVFQQDPADPRSIGNLTIDPGVTIKFVDQRTIPGNRIVFYAPATLTAIGTPAAHITFTSIRDDGVDVPQPGDWYSVSVFSSAVVAYADFKYGGWGCCDEWSAQALIIGDQATLNMDSSTIQFSQLGGLGVGHEAVVTNSQFTDNGTQGIYVADAHLVLQHSHVKRNGGGFGGVYIIQTGYAGPASSITHCDITDNLVGIYMKVARTTTMPYGHQNNIINNSNPISGPDNSQLFNATESLPSSDWKDNYWGPDIKRNDCSWALPPNTGSHLTFGDQLTDCLLGTHGPVVSTDWPKPDPSCHPISDYRFCWTDWFITVPFSLDPFDNSLP